MTKTKPAWIGWHFLPEDGKTRYTREKVRVGGIIREKRPLEMCTVGCHASPTPLQALQYAPGPIACLVELCGDRIDDTDKSCAAERKCLAKIDATKILRLFACWCAEQALRAERKAGREPDMRSWKSVRVARRFACGSATTDELAAANAAANAATCATANANAWAAANAAGWATAKDAMGAAWAAVNAAANAAGWANASVAWYTAISAQNKKLESLLCTAMGATIRFLPAKETE